LCFFRGGYIACVDGEAACVFFRGGYIACVDGEATFGAIVILLFSVTIARPYPEFSFSPND
jgi:hypothetical protein